MAESVRSHVLSNGLRCVHCSTAGRAGYLGLMVDAGSRDEAPGEEGLAHFVEHTIFKGTSKRKSWHIINRMESIGGELNAYTTKETTAVYSIFPAGYLDRGMELIADLVAYSQFPQAEIDREREVVADEINSYLDIPSEAVVDDFDDLIFAGSPLGHNILGNLDTLRTFDSGICRRYLTGRYTPGRMVLFFSGSDSADAFFRRAERYFGVLHHPDMVQNRCKPAQVAQFCHTRHINTHQAHTVLGARIGSMFSHDRYAMALLTNIIGGPGMNSLLNVELRERRGLVYTVEASTALYTDCGLFSIYFGCDPDDTERCRRLVSNVVNRLADRPLSDRALAAARRQYVGQLTVASENKENRALGIGRSMLYRNHVATDRELVEAIESVTAAELRAAADRIVPQWMSALTLG